MGVHDEELLIPSNEEPELTVSKTRAEEISINFSRIGSSLLVLGVLTTVMGIIAICVTLYSMRHIGEGIWCGIPVSLCGGLCIATRYSLHFKLVMASFIMNVISSVLLMFGITFTVITSSMYTDGYSVEKFILFGLGVNVWLCGCLPICIYLSIVYYKILKQDKQNCCDWDCFSRYNGQESSGYRFIYVPVET